jgi:hypothetical protein
MMGPSGGVFFSRADWVVGEFFGNCEGKKWRKMKNAFFLEKIGSRINKIIGNLVHNPKSRTYLPMQHHKYFVLPHTL